MSFPHDNFSSTTFGGVDFFGVSSSNGNATASREKITTHDKEITDDEADINNHYKAAVTTLSSHAHLNNSPNDSEQHDLRITASKAAYVDAHANFVNDPNDKIGTNKNAFNGSHTGKPTPLKTASSLDAALNLNFKQPVSQNPIQLGQASAADASSTSDEREPGETGSLSGVDLFTQHEHFDSTPQQQQHAPRRPPRLRRPENARFASQNAEQAQNDIIVALTTAATTAADSARWFDKTTHHQHSDKNTESGCQKHIVHLLNEKSGFERQLRTARTEIDQLRAQLNQSSGKEAFKQLQQMSDRLAQDYNATISGLNDELERVRCELNRASLAIRKMTTRQLQVAKENQVLKRKLDEKDVEITDTETRINTKTQRVIELELDIEAQKRNQKSFESATRNLKKELDSLKDHNRLLMEKIDGLEENAEQLQDRLHSANERRDQAAHERSEALMKTSTMQAEIEQLKKDLNDLRLHRSTATRLDIENATHELETKLQAIQHEYEQLQRDVKTAVVERDSFKRRCEELRNKIDQIERYDAEKTDALNKDRSSLMAKLADADKQRDALQFDAHNLQAKLSAQQQSVATLKEDEARSTAKVREKTAKLVLDLERTLKDRLELLDKLEKREAEFQSLNIISKRAAKVHEDEVHRLNAQLERHRMLFDTNLKQVTEAHSIELSQLRSTISAKEAAANKFQQQAADQSDAYERQLRTLHEKYEGEKSRREKLEPQLYSAWKTLQAKDFQLTEAVNIFRNMADILRRTPSLEHLVKPIGQLLQQSLNADGDQFKLSPNNRKWVSDDDDISKPKLLTRVKSLLAKIRGNIDEEVTTTSFEDF